jgi:hypothetical protein
MKSMMLQVEPMYSPRQDVSPNRDAGIRRGEVHKPGLLQSIAKQISTG